MAYTQTQLEVLQAALASGELEVMFEGRRIRYRSIEELERAIATVQGELTTQTGTKRVRRVQMTVSKGLE